VVVGAGSTVEGGSGVSDSVLLDGVRVGGGARVTGSIVGAGSELLGARVSGSVLGERVQVLPGAELVDARVEPGTTVPQVPGSRPDHAGSM